MIELLEPTHDDVDIAEFLKARGEGIHHFAYEVSDVAAAIKGAEQGGLRLIDRAPRAGARGSAIGFVDPEREDGVLVEFVQTAASPARPVRSE